MKLIHTSDWHLGRILYGRSLISDQTHFINEFFFPLIEREKPDGVIMAGDLFDRQIAPTDAIRLFDSFVTRICLKMNIPLIAITGNHDGADRLGLGSELMREAGFALTSRLDPAAPPTIFNSGAGKPVHIYSLPYFDPAMARDCLQDDSIRGFSDAYKAILSRMVERLDESAFNILTCHCFVLGSAISDSESPLFIGGSGEVDGSLFDRFDYVALGHLHKPQPAGKTGFYSGSPLKYSFDEEKQEKSVTVLEITEKIARRVIPVQPLRDMRTLTGNIDELRESAKADSQSDDYVYAVLTGPPVFEPMGALKTFYPNTLGMRNGDLSYDGETRERDTLRKELKNQNSMMIFEEFLRQMCDTEPTDDDREVFIKAAASHTENPETEPFSGSAATADTVSAAAAGEVAE